MKEKIVITMGRTYIDIDAYASCIAYRELLKLQGKENTIAVSNGVKNESITDTILNLSLQLDDKTQWNQQDNIIVIDVSDPNYIDSMVVEENMIEIIDHHTGFEQFWKEKLGEKAQIEFIGSCATLIFEKWEQAGYIDKMDKQIARLLCYAILDNTLNFKSKVTTVRDRNAYTTLSSIGEIEHDFAEKYFRECQQKIEEDLEIGIKNDYKQVEKNPYLPSIIGRLVIWEKNELNTNIQLFEKVLGKVAKQWMLNLICLQEEKSFLIANNKEVQEKLEKLFNKKFDGNMLELNLILRKEIMKKAQDKIKETQ